MIPERLSIPAGATGTTPLQVSAVQDWTDTLCQELSSLYQQKEKAQDSPWAGRWNVSASYFDWKCARNPVRPSVAAYIRRDDGHLAGAVTVTFRQLVVGSRQCMVGELADLYLQPYLRGTLAFAQLVQAAIQKARQSGVDLVFCIPNRTGAGALVKTGIFNLVPAAEHATWLAPLRPLAVLAQKKPIAARLAFLDGLCRGGGAMLNARAVAGVERSMADATAGYQPPDDACALRMASSAAWLSYRTVDYPVPDTYRALARPGKPAAEVVIRRSGLLGLPALFGARLDAASPRELGEQAGLILRQAMREGCAFAALWAPRRGAWSRALWRRGFAPVQHKQLLVAQNASGALLELLPRLRLDMLDSDKI